MDHLHFRYVTEQPRGQTLRRLFQLLDDMPADLRHDLLRDLFTDFNVFSELLDARERATVRYRELKSKMQDLATAAPVEQPVVYGLVCFILGNVHARYAVRLPHLIDQKRDGVREGIPTEWESLQSLRDEQETLRNAYSTFCKLVIGPLLGDVEVADFGNEWAFEDAEPVPPEVVRATLAQQEGTQPGDEASLPSNESDAVIGTFLEELASYFEVAIRTGPRMLAVRNSDKAISVSVGEYCGSSEPTIWRLNLRGLSFSDPAFQQLGLPRNPKYYFESRLEFSLLLYELPNLVSWTAEWILFQEAQHADAPIISILLENHDVSPFGGSNSTDWRTIDYLWSQAARDAYTAWRNNDDQTPGDH